MLTLKTDVPLAPHTTFRIGGPARWYVEPASPSDFGEALSWALTRKVPFFVLGGGSNVLVHDDGFDGLVINTNRLANIDAEGVRVRAECGVVVDDLVDFAARRRLAGLEFAAGLPGSVGGALFMNARAYEGSFAAVVEKVETFEKEGTRVRERELGGEHLGFGYKKSVFQGGRLFVAAVTFRLAEGREAHIRARSEENRRKRREMGQYLFPNAGCIFKNDYNVGIPTGRIVEELGLKGLRIGDAQVFERHANFIVNRGRASAADVHALILRIEDEVSRRRGITLEREIILVGEWGKP